MEYTELPPFAAWQFVDGVNGFEVVYRNGFGIREHTSAVEAGQAYAVRYEISFDARWRTREVHVHNDTAHGPRSTALVSDGQGSWTVDGRRAPQLDGLYDVDLEASACTNTLPVHRLDLPHGDVVQAPAPMSRHWTSRSDVSTRGTGASTTTGSTTAPRAASTRCCVTTSTGSSSTTPASPGASPEAPADHYRHRCGGRSGRDPRAGARRRGGNP